MFYIYQLPVPRVPKQNVFYRMIVERAAKLICTTSEFQSLWELTMNSTWSTEVGAIDKDQRLELRAELDGIIAHLYGVNEEEFTYILQSFPLVEQEIKVITLAAYQKFAGPVESLQLAELIARGESRTVEFKETACYNAYTGQKNNEARDNIVKEVAAFLNSREGGTLLIGVKDDGTVVGLENDYRTANPQKNSRDGYELFLMDILNNNLMGQWSLLYHISFGVVEGKEVCRIDVQPASGPVFLTTGEMHIRDGNRQKKLTPYEAMEYQRQRWPK